MIRKDTLWKGIIEDLVEEFVHFFFAEYVDQIDFSKGFEFLDKELEQLSPQAAASFRHADKLFKGWLKLGGEHWFLVHVEVQGYADPDFARRMFEYAYRIQDRYKRPVTALVIYTNTDRRYHFTEYHSTFFGTEIRYCFQSFILIDHSPDKLRQSGNWFGFVLEIARRELEFGKKDDQHLLDGKLELVRHLFQQGIPKNKIRCLLDFIGYYMLFEKPDFLYKFEEEVQMITKSNRSMGIREAILNEVEERGIEKGIEQGINEKERIIVTRGRQKGLSPADIADLADMTVEKVEAIIQDLERE